MLFKNCEKRSFSKVVNNYPFNILKSCLFIFQIGPKKKKLEKFEKYHNIYI